MVHTIFVTGEFASNHLDGIRDIENRGQYIGVYGWRSGEDLTLMNYDKQIELMEKAISAVRKDVRNPKYVVDFKP